MFLSFKREKLTNPSQVLRTNVVRAGDLLLRCTSTPLTPGLRPIAGLDHFPAPFHECATPAGNGRGNRGAAAAAAFTGVQQNVKRPPVTFSV